MRRRWRRRVEQTADEGAVPGAAPAALERGRRAPAREGRGADQPEEERHPGPAELAPVVRRPPGGADPTGRREGSPRPPGRRNARALGRPALARERSRQGQRPVRGDRGALRPEVDPEPAHTPAGLQGQGLRHQQPAERRRRSVAAQRKSTLRKTEGRLRGPRIRSPACFGRGASCCSSPERGAYSESPTLAWRFPSQVPGTRPYRLAPPLPVLSSLKSDHLLSAVISL